MCVWTNGGADGDAHVCKQEGRGRSRKRGWPSTQGQRAGQKAGRAQGPTRTADAPAPMCRGHRQQSQTPDKAIRTLVEGMRCCQAREAKVIARMLEPAHTPERAAAAAAVAAIAGASVGTPARQADPHGIRPVGPSRTHSTSPTCRCRPGRRARPRPFRYSAQSTDGHGGGKHARRDP